jgi:hypothetical protein
MTKIICSECGRDDEVKTAAEYAELAELLDVWNLLERQGPVLLCSKCASLVVGEMSLDTVKIMPLDFLEADDPDK